MTTASRLLHRVKNFVIGGARSVDDPALFQKISLVALLAWVGLGSDGLTSSSYGPEEAFLALGSHVPLGIFVAAATALTIFVIAASYSQIVEVFPGGGGGYVVASKLLNPTLGMASGCALLVDYVLTIALSIASGTDAIFSSLPISYQPLKLVVAAGGVILLILLNFRGVRESVMTLTPVFLIFIVMHVVAVVYAVGGQCSAVRRSRRPDGPRGAADLGGGGKLWGPVSDTARVQHGGGDIHRDRGSEQRDADPPRAAGSKRPRPRCATWRFPWPSWPRA